MSKIVKIQIDGEEIMAEEGKFLTDAAFENGVYIPTLCNISGIKPKGACRICSVKINGRPMTACTTPISEGMQIENNTKEMNGIRKAIIEALFVEGNHFCPSCEKSGCCELQALAYRFKIMVPRYPFLFPVREVDASNARIIKDHNRCILCKRCIRAIKDNDGKNIFAFKKRGHKIEINVDPDLAYLFTDELAQKAMDVCPVGAIIRKEKGFVVPVGKRKFDLTPIGNDVESL